MADQYTVLDFDETVYLKDSLVTFHWFCVKQNPLLAVWFPFQVGGFILHKLGLISTQTFKNIFLLFLGFYAVEKIENAAVAFWKNEFPARFNKDVLDVIKQHQNVVIITASPLIYFRFMIEQFPEVIFIGTQLKKWNGFYIIEGKNCKGPEKLVQFYHRFGNNAQIVNAYSDSLSDQPLFDAAQHAFFLDKGVIKQLH